MLSQSLLQVWGRCSHRRLLAAAGELLIVAVFVWGVGLAIPALAQKDENKPSEPKKDKTIREEPKKEEPRKEQADKEDTKKTDADKEIDELVKEMTKNLPNANAAALKQIREQVQNMPAQQRKNLLSMMKNRNQLGFPGQPPGGGMMPPGFGFPSQNARLGVFVDPPVDALREQLDLPAGQGLTVRQVLPDSAAAKAGLKPHDLLLEFDGKPVPNRVEEFTRLVTAVKPDTTLEIVVMRKGKKETIKDVKLPEVKALQSGFPQAAFPQTPPFPQAGFPGAGQPPGGFPQPPVGFQPPGLGGAATVVTTLIRSKDSFTVRHQEGNVILTLMGKAADGKSNVNQIRVQEGFKSEQYESVDKVPEKYHNKVKNLIELSEKSSAKVESKTVPKDD